MTKEMKCKRCGKNAWTSDSTVGLCECPEGPQLQNDYSPQNPNSLFYGTGWTCPKCGSVYSPWTSECGRCNGPYTVTYSTPSS